LFGRAVGRINSEREMSNEAKAKVKSGGGGFGSRLNQILYSGEKKHVFAGLVLITAVFSVPWFLMNRGSFLSNFSFFIIIIIIVNFLKLVSKFLSFPLHQ